MTTRADTARESRSLARAIHRLYHGRDRRAVLFRYGLLAFDVVTVVIFIVDSMLPPLPSMRLIDALIAVVLILDFTARCLIAPHRLRYLIQPVTLADFVVILTLLLPFLFHNWAFLRVLRALRLLRSYRVVHELEAKSRLFKRHRAMFDAAINLVVFIFVITAVVFVTQRDVNPQIPTYVDALYYTVATLTTTGFGDITLSGESGKLLAVLIMLVGIGLFLRLVQAVFRPSRVDAPCPDCGLRYHDEDAIHCKHCGRLLNIETEGGG